jgi:putative nucleotidyltransferase with HDIG domain
MLTFADIPYFSQLQDVAKKRQTRIFLVGGFLRDVLLSRKSVDYDFATERQALETAACFARAIKGAYVLLDEERGCARVVKKKGKTIHTYDFANFREKSLLQDLTHRDFTINTLSVALSRVRERDVIRDKIEDRKNGLPDIQKRTIRMVSPEVFQEDPLRILRAFSLKALLRFRIDPATAKQIRKDKDRLRTVSFERISVELFKILESERASPVVNQMDRIGLMVKVIPQIAGMVRCLQGPYHHLDVWRHSKETLKQFEKIARACARRPDIQTYLDGSLGGNRSRKALVKLAVLLHDVGKPETRKMVEGKYSFHAHEHMGKKITRHVARMLKLSTRERHALEDMVQLHLRPGYLSNDPWPTDRAVYRFFRDAGEESVSILLLSLADQKATRGPLTPESDQKHHERICWALIDEYFRKQREKPLPRLVTGHDVMRRLNIAPSREVGRILSVIEEKQALGKIATKQEAYAEMEAIHKKAT